MKPVKLSDFFLRWTLVLLAIATLAVSCYAIAAGVRVLGDPGVVNEVESMYLTNAGLFIFVAILAFLAIWPTGRVSVLGTSYSRPILSQLQHRADVALQSSVSAIVTTLVFAILIATTTFSATLVYLARHFQYKDDFWDACSIQRGLETPYPNRKEACAKEWNKGIGYKVAYVVVTIFVSAVAIELARTRLRRARKAAKATNRASSPPASMAAYTPTRDHDDNIELAQPAIEQAALDNGHDKPAPSEYEETLPAYSRDA